MSSNLAGRTILRFERSECEDCRAVGRRTKAGNINTGKVRSYDSAGQTVKTYTVYIIQSIIQSERFYTGVTKLNINERLAYHNRGQVFNTAKFAPWSIKTYIVFTDKDQAYAFERYLKTASGRAFAKKRL